MLVIKSEDLQHQTEDTLISIFEFLGLDSNLYDFENLKLTTKEHVTKDKLIASQSIEKANKSRFFKKIKLIFSWLIPVFKPVWNLVFYRKRKILALTPENEAYLKAAYKKDLENLKSHSCHLSYDL